MLASLLGRRLGGKGGIKGCESTGVGSREGLPKAAYLVPQLNRKVCSYPESSELMRTKTF